jgi:hypothetical protein
MTERPVIRNEPSDRLTELCDEMGKVLDRPENADVKCVIMLHDDDVGGLVIKGAYEDATDAAVDILMHLRAIFQASGKELLMVPMMGAGGVN